MFFWGKGKLDQGNKCFAVFFIIMLMGSGILAHLEQFKYSSGTPYDEIINLFFDMLQFFCFSINFDVCGCFECKSQQNLVVF